MKKFLSLLLALTMVLSLVVVPARAAGDTLSGATLDHATLAVETGSNATLEVNLSGLKIGADSISNTEKFASIGNPSVTFASSAPAVAAVTQNPLAGQRATVTALSAGTATITATVTVNYKLVSDGVGAEAKTATQQLPCTVTVNAPDCTKAVASIVCNTITSTVSEGNAAAYYTVADQALSGTDFTAVCKTGFRQTAAATLVNDTLTVPVEHIATKTQGSTVIRLTENVVGVPTVTITPAPDKRLEGQNLTLTATAENAPEGASYIWTYGGPSSTADASASLTPARTSTVTVSAPARGSYKVFCKVAFGSAVVASIGNDLTTLADPYEPDYNAKDNTKTATLSPSTNAGLSLNKTWQIPMPRLKNTTVGSNESLVPGTTSGCTVKFTSNAPTVASVNETSGLVTAGSKAGNATITAAITYNGKTYAKVLTYTVTNRVLEATLTAVQNNTPLTLDGRSYYGNLSAAAQSALATNGITATIASVTLTAGPVTNGYIQQTNTANYYTFTGTTIGVATFTGTVTTVNPIATYTVTFNIPVTPISTTYADQYPEPTNGYYGNANRYAVQIPSGYSSYYVVSKNSNVAPTDWSQRLTGTANSYSGANLYTLTDNDFVNGKCVLSIVTYASSTTYPYTASVAYCGQLTVYQKNYNINYNGVAGETVQFKHADFTNFMNEVAQARGDSSKTTSYPYVTFNNVTFSLPSTAQGTLYYNGVAMSNSNASGAFNTRTQITNLDNVTFVPYAKSNAKSITLNFTLSGTRYNNYGGSLGTPVTYSGAVVINIVREDIKYTVAPGDSISFTGSDFLNYLRTQSGINYNYNVDYVTFDQSAVNLLTGGVLYSNYSGFSQVKSTDKFYYTASGYTQSALNDVTFRASNSAKTGSTVYIPFTIYTKLGTSSVISKEVTGTVAIKIAQTMNFVDVKPTDYFYNPVKWALTKNITKGTSATTFSPNKTCSRAEIVTFLWRDAGCPTATITRNPFSDVSYSMGSDFYNAILWASQNGITAGTDATHFSPNKTCTRAEIVTFLWRYAKKPASYGNNPFTDVNKTDHAPYYDAILWAVSKGITTGSTASTFSPNGTCTRGEAVTFLFRFEGGK